MMADALSALNENGKRNLGGVASPFHGPQPLPALTILRAVLPALEKLAAYSTAPQTEILKRFSACLLKDPATSDKVAAACEDVCDLFPLKRDKPERMTLETFCQHAAELVKERREQLVNILSNLHAENCYLWDCDFEPLGMRHYVQHGCNDHPMSFEKIWLKLRIFATKHAEAAMELRPSIVALTTRLLKYATERNASVKILDSFATFEQLMGLKFLDEYYFKTFLYHLTCTVLEGEVKVSCFEQIFILLTALKKYQLIDLLRKSFKDTPPHPDLVNPMREYFTNSYSLPKTVEQCAFILQIIDPLFSSYAGSVEIQLKNNERVTLLKTDLDYLKEVSLLFSGYIENLTKNPDRSRTIILTELTKAEFENYIQLIKAKQIMPFQGTLKAWTHFALQAFRIGLKPQFVFTFPKEKFARSPQNVTELLRVQETDLYAFFTVGPYQQPWMEMRDALLSSMLAFQAAFASHPEAKEIRKFFANVVELACTQKSEKWMYIQTLTIPEHVLAARDLARCRYLKTLHVVENAMATTGTRSSAPPLKEFPELEELSIGEQCCEKWLTQSHSLRTLTLPSSLAKQTHLQTLFPNLQTVNYWTHPDQVQLENEER